ncbi:MAG: dihydroneopterin aldolase [Bacteroidetes bacterium]|nr:dihydroneopterin aldolase [Bacteroidota bacterium]MDA1223873.1 dihydroneopterin aldolase [Bacteroidota bacterium]
MLTTIFIDQQLVHSNIGYFEIERIVGVELYISVKVMFKSSSISDDLNNSLDYSTLSQIITSESKNSMELLETLGENILTCIEQVGVVGHQSTWLKIEKKQMLQKGFHAKGFGIELSKDYGQ